mgnify:CR=1 FL=1
MQLKKLVVTLCIACLCSCKSEAQKKETFKINKSEAEWKSQLTDIQYYVLRKEGTERAFPWLNRNQLKTVKKKEFTIDDDEAGVGREREREREREKRKKGRNKERERHFLVLF